MAPNHDFGMLGSNSVKWYPAITLRKVPKPTDPQAARFHPLPRGAVAGRLSLHLPVNKKPGEKSVGR